MGFKLQKTIKKEAATNGWKQILLSMKNIKYEK